MEQKNSSAKLGLRKAEPHDAKAISQLVNSAYRGVSSQRGWTTEAHFLEGQRTDVEAISETISKPSQWILVAERDGQLIACANIEKINSEICYFGMFAVNPEMQDQGIGRLFLAEAEEFARQQLNAKAMEMTVITIREELIAWYERRGYQFTGEVRPFFYGQERFGIPLRQDLQLGVWRKSL